MQIYTQKIARSKNKHDVILSNILEYVDQNEMQALKTCTFALQAELNNQRFGRLANKKVLVAYGGGKDSSYMLAYVRIIQLLILKEHGETFKIRICTNRQMGMVKAVMENIHNVYIALGLYDDPYAEMFFVDAQQIIPFAKDTPISTSVKEMNRKEVLMSGHGSQGDGRPTFCNACNLSMVTSFWVTAWYQGGVDMVITGDSKKELRDYYIWVRRLSLKLGDTTKEGKGFNEFLRKMNIISEKYFAEIFDKNSNEIKIRTIRSDIKEVRAPVFFSVFDYTSYSAGDHWKMLTDFLGFNFDSIAFSFSESDCANPALMAHLRGLKAERLYNRKYSDGIADYLLLAIELMKKKNFPSQLVNMAVKRYENEESISVMRVKMQEYAKDAFDLTEEQLICLVYSPFIEKGARLKVYLEKEQPALASSYVEICELLSEETCNDSKQCLLHKLSIISGLTISEMRFLYQINCLQTKDNKSVVSLILRDDPHKKIIETIQDSSGVIVKEMISGR